MSDHPGSLELLKKINETNDFIQSHFKEKPKTALVLGSGLGSFADSLKNKTTLSYSKIPHFQKTTVAGHAGELVCGTLQLQQKEISLLCFKGRFHFYEGHELKDVVYPIRLLKNLGLQNLILTNASGGINTRFKAGDLMAITDHINLTGTNPLIGPNISELGPRFPDMSTCYSKKLLSILEKTALELKIQLHQGVYLGTTGPSYETPAEIKMFRYLGADAVGMSTVSEAIIAAHSGLEVCGLSCITNLGTGMSPTKLSHEEVIENSALASQKMIQLLTQFIIKL